jgi:hypothetical protein
MNGKLMNENISVPNEELLGHWIRASLARMRTSRARAAGYRTISVLSAVMGVTAFVMISLVGPILLGL